MIPVDRQRPVTAIGAVVLAAAAAVIGLRFRALPPATDLRSMTWDAAAHALIGLDVFDHLRRFEPLRLLLRLQGEHWWPPLFGILSLPAYLIGGRELSSPSLVSFAAYCLIPAVAWLSVRRVTTAVPLLAFSVVALFFLRSPQMIEMSTWSMLELTAAFFAAAAFYFFLADPHSRARNWAYGFAGASTLLKYHYGFFLLVTLGVATVLELERNELRAIASRTRARFQHAVAWIPGVPTLIWIAYIGTLIAMTSRLSKTRVVWASLPAPIRRFVACGLIWPMIWCLDLANVQAWYRQLRVQTNPPARWTDQIHELSRYLTDDYFLGPAALGAAIVGLALAILEGIRRRRVDVLAVAFHAIWPVALMTLSKYRIESRFLATVMLALMLSAALGWTLFLERGRVVLRIAASVALLGLLIAEVAARESDWQQQLVRRRVYGYASSDPPDQFVRATVKAFTRGQPVLIVLPRDIEVVAPTIRLGLRVAMPNVAPHAVIVRGGDTGRFASRLRRFRGGVVGVETDPATLQRMVEQNGMKVVRLERGPELPTPGRALLLAHIVNR